MTHAERLAAFVVRASYNDLSEAARQQLKVRVLDSLGCAIGALENALGLEKVMFEAADPEVFAGTSRTMARK
jgi:2-methylcitrate dehydratase